MDVVAITEKNGRVVSEVFNVSERGFAPKNLGLNQNAFEATQIENEVASARVHHFRSNGLEQPGNYGYLEGRVNGKPVDNKMWQSGDALETEPKIFDAIIVEGKNGSAFLRDTDSEYKMLNQLAFDLNGQKGQIYKDVFGELKIVSENPYCKSCRSVIKQFNEMFPNIKLTLVNGVK